MYEQLVICDIGNNKNAYIVSIQSVFLAGINTVINSMFLFKYVNLNKKFKKYYGSIFSLPKLV